MQPGSFNSPSLGTKVWGRLPAISELQSQVSLKLVFSDSLLGKTYGVWLSIPSDRSIRSIVVSVVSSLCTKNIQKQHHIPWNVNPPLHYFISNIIHHRSPLWVQCITVLIITSPPCEQYTNNYIVDEIWWQFKQESTKHAMFSEVNHHFLHFFTPIPGWNCPTTHCTEVRSQPWGSCWRSKQKMLEKCCRKITGDTTTGDAYGHNNRQQTQNVMKGKCTINPYI